MSNSFFVLLLAPVTRAVRRPTHSFRVPTYRVARGGSQSRGTPVELKTATVDGSRVTA